MARTRRRTSSAPNFGLDKRLVLNQYMLGLFGKTSFEELAEGLKEPEFEGEDEGVSLLYRELVLRFPTLSGTLPLRDYDENIVRHTRRIGAKRGEPIRWRYFQYLSLLFTEIYLHKYFVDVERLRDDLNEHVRVFNEDKEEADKVPKYETEDLRKLAFWMATGSGKTLLMHVNVLQYLHYQNKYGKPDDLNRIILLTPNEGLSLQHATEFERSGLKAEAFAKGKTGDTLFGDKPIEIIDIHKLGEEMGEKTVAIGAFEQNNLVLVDEGHRGAGGLEWKARRDALCEDGFTFEYSATFGQAMKAAGKNDLTREYAKCILFDYSYRYFYRDGYGKDFSILNLEDERSEDVQRRYLTASLLTFHQQQVLYEDRKDDFAPYDIERPLWMFVGSSITKSSTKEKTDAVEILLFLARFVRERDESIEILNRLVSGNTGLTHKGRDLFADKFAYLMPRGFNGAALYDSILSRFFNAEGAGSSLSRTLRVEEMKGVPGELALRVGDHDPFGVVNVGDSAGLAKLLRDEEGLIVSDRAFGNSIFDELNSRGSTVNLLVGARKFAEGWSSWRVSSMGLMNVGQKEGSQIVQLFGRGVRLKGLDFGLKRSSSVPQKHPAHIRVLETLNVFGLRADYMKVFEAMLAEDGVPLEPVSITLPVVKNLTSGAKLRMVRVGDGGDFKKHGPKLVLPDEPPKSFLRRPIPLDWYPKMGVLESATGAPGMSETREQNSLGKKQLAFMDLDAVYFELVRFKKEKGWHNFSLSKRAVASLLEDSQWYKLSIASADLKFPASEPFRRVRAWQEIAVALLKKFCDRYYKNERERFQADFIEYRELDGGDANFFDEYEFRVDQSQQVIVDKLLELKRDIEAGKLSNMRFGPLDVFAFDRHLYRPLVHLTNSDVKVTPVALNEGEQRFVRDLEAFYRGSPGYFEGKELYLLRNMSIGRGIGFFEAGNFYPDFVMWLVEKDEERQCVTFIDPKGIIRLDGIDDPKIRFHETIKGIQERLCDPRVVLASFIVSNTPYAQLPDWGASKGELEDRHVLFQKDDADTYVENMLNRILRTVDAAG